MRTYKIGCRGLSYLFRRKWYSLYRWENAQEYEGYRVRVIDIGAFYFSEWKRIT